MVGSKSVMYYLHPKNLVAVHRFGLCVSFQHGDVFVKSVLYVVRLPYIQVGSGCPVLIFAADMAFPGMWMVCTVF
jgi:hypothetical protein